MNGYRRNTHIDEPEINLHPDNQVVLTRVLGELVNKGLRLIISTHSDYIVREINNLIMAGELKAAGSQSQTEFGYSDEMMLDRKQVRAYYFEPSEAAQVVVDPAPIDRYGFSVATIDQTIRLQNEITDNLHDILKFDYPKL